MTLTCYYRHERRRADAVHDVEVKRFAFNRWKKVHNRILVCRSTFVGSRSNRIRIQALERRADRQIARQEDVLVRAIVRVWKAHQHGRLLERVHNSRVLRHTWEAWKKRLRQQKELEGLVASL